MLPKPNGDQPHRAKSYRDQLPWWDSIRSHTHRESRIGGFTLIELLVVIVIIAILASLVTPDVFRYVGDAKTDTAKSQIQTLSLALDAYRLDNGSYPSTDQGLAALRTMPTSGTPPQHWHGPYLTRQIPNDPWERPFVYISPGRVNIASYDLYTLGKDAAISGTGENEDVTSWNGLVSGATP